MMRRLNLLTILTVAAVSVSLSLSAQTLTEEEFLPKYPTASERNFMEMKAAQFAEALKNRGPLSAAERNAGSCEDNCGGQAPAGCWCDDLCSFYGDCCDDFEDFCLVVPDEVPEGLVVPGEFEESQAVILRWPYSSVGAARTRLYAELIDAVQQEVPAWIFINNASDSVGVKNALNNYGVTLQNYSFMVKQTNSIWARDYGPWGFYYGENDELAFIDMQYYPSRPLDNAVPAWLADQMGIEVYTSDMYDEGGNLMVDGFGRAFHSTGTFQRNASGNGWSEEFTRETHQALFNTVSAVEADRLQCDGGTGHIDMYAKLIDEQTLIVTEYPDVVTASDRVRIENNVALFEAEETEFGGNFVVERLPMPLRNDGSYSTSCSQINADARGFVNGLLVNKTFIVPIYSNENSPQTNRDWDEAALDMVRELMPGYNVVGIDARSLTPSGGAIHCVTMQIPTDNPLRFRHERIAGLQPALSAYPFEAEITNKSGIAAAQVYWRLKGESDWNQIPMTASGEVFNAELVNPGFTVSDTVQYYIQAESNNGKTAAKPYVAPDGYFTFYFEEDYDTDEECEIPDGLFTTNITATGVTLNWTPVPGADGYTIRGSRVGSSSIQTVNISNGNASSRTVNVLDPGLDYYWQIRTNCEEGAHSDWSESDFFTSACTAPIGLTASNISASSALLSWDEVPQSFGYQLRGKRVTGSGFITINIAPGSTSQNTGNQLDPLTQYEWNVRAYCDAAQNSTSPWSETSFFTTPGSGMTGIPEGELDLTVFPNPNEGGILYLKADGPDTDFAVIVRDVTGREIFKRQFPAHNAGGVIEADLGRASSGVYLVQLISGDRQITRKLIVK